MNAMKDKYHLKVHFFIQLWIITFLLDQTSEYFHIEKLSAEFVQQENKPPIQFQSTK